MLIFRTSLLSPLNYQNHPRLQQKQYSTSIINSTVNASLLVTETVNCTKRVQSNYCHQILGEIDEKYSAISVWVLFCTLRQKTETHFFRHWNVGAKVRRKKGGGVLVLGLISGGRGRWNPEISVHLETFVRCDCSTRLDISRVLQSSILPVFFFFFSFDELISDETESIFQRGRRKQEGSGGRTLALVSAPRWE